MWWEHFSFFLAVTVLVVIVRFPLFGPPGKTAIVSKNNFRKYLNRISKTSSVEYIYIYINKINMNTRTRIEHWDRNSNVKVS